MLNTLNLNELYPSQSSNELLPDNIKAVQVQKDTEREKVVKMTTKLDDDANSPVTLWDIKITIKKGKSTAAGDDGITCRISEALTEVDQPLLLFFNLNYIADTTPNDWKDVIINPVPKYADPDAFRPIYLISCSFKMLERILLNILLGKNYSKTKQEMKRFHAK